MPDLSLTIAILVFIGLAAVVAFAGTYLTRTGDKIADFTGLGEALVGGILIGGITSLSGVVTSVTAAVDGYAQLSFSNAIGGIAAQTLFLIVADLSYKRANLEHAAASLPNLMQGSFLIIMLTFVICVMMVPSFTVWMVNPASILLIAIYLTGSYLITRASKNPMWRPRMTIETVKDSPDYQNLSKKSMLRVYVVFALSAVTVAVAGYFIAKVAVIIAEKSIFSESFVGALFTSVATSLPELVVCVAAVRQRALTLAVANILGGNSFDVLFLSFADFGFAEGSIYHHVGPEQHFILGLTTLLTGILLLGMLHRQKEGIAKAGWESISLIFLFVMGYAILYFAFPG